MILASSRLPVIHCVPNRTHDYSIRVVKDDGKMYGIFGYDE